MTISTETARRRYYDAMGETNKLMEKWDIFERPKHPEYVKARVKEDRMFKQWERVSKGKQT